jgi:hypothetical protein
MPWDKVSKVLMFYLDNTLLLFRKTEILFNPERRVEGIKIDDKILSTVSALEASNNHRRRKLYNVNFFNLYN